LLDREALFARRWQMLKHGASTRERNEAEQTLRQLMLKTRRLWQPGIVFGLFSAKLAASGLAIRAGRGRAILKLSANFQRRLAQRWDTEEFLVALQVVTVGGGIVREAQRLARAGNIHEQFLLHGLAAELTEALAEQSQSRVMRQAGWKAARRYSPGYPVLPELADQRAIFRLLNPKRIGVRLTRSYQMVPEYSTSAILIEK